MMKHIIEKLKAYSEIKDYRLTSVTSKTTEVFYILDKVETIRNTHLDASINVTIYCDYEQQRGQASFVCFASYTDTEIDAKIQAAIYQTKFSKNTYYPLPSGETKIFGVKKPSESNEVAFKIADAVFKASIFKDGWISSLEVFVKESTVHLINSRGVDYTYFKNAISIEIIPTFKNPSGEIELYTNLDYANINYEKITKDTATFLSQADLRNKAKAYMGPNNLPVLLDAKEIQQIMWNLVDNLEYSVVFNQMDLVKVGACFYGENPVDAPAISLVPFVEDSITNKAVDADGIVLKDTKIVENNIVLTNHGDNKHAYYLGIKNPTGVLPNIYMQDGSFTTQELTKKEHLHCLSFSAFQFDIFSGNFGGEIRLAHYFDGNAYHPVTGLTISGNIHTLKSHLKFSKERSNIASYSGPTCVLVENTNIN